MKPILQTEVRSAQAWAKVGQVTKGSHSYFMDADGIVADKNVCVGCFVKAKTNSKDFREVVGASGVEVQNNDRIIGVVIFPEFIPGCSGPEHIIPEGRNIKIMVRGSIAIETETVAKQGQYVFLKNSDGALVFDDNPTKDDHTPTGWVVTKPSSDNVVDPEVIEITSL